MAIRVAELRPAVEASLSRFKNLIAVHRDFPHDLGSPELFNASDAIEGRADDYVVKLPVVALRAFLLRNHLLGFPNSGRLLTLAFGTDAWRPEDSRSLAPDWIHADTAV